MNVQRLSSVLITTCVRACLPLCLFFWSVPASLGQSFTYQGQLKSSDQPVDGTADLQVSLWDSPDSACAPQGLQIGVMQGINGVAVSHGLFTVTLNGGGEFGPTAFNGSARWLEIEVRIPAGSGAFTTLCPRQAVTAAPYALHAFDAPHGHSLDAVDGSPTDAVYVDAGGKVGIGTLTPNQKLTVYAGNLLLQTNDNGQTQGLLFQNAASNYTWRLYRRDAGNNFADLRIGGGLNPDPSLLSDILTLTNSGNVGIGTTTPGAKLDVAGTTKMTGFQLGTTATAGQVLTTDASGAGTWQALPVGVTYTAGAGLSLSGNQFSLAPLGVTNSMVNDVAWSKITGAPTGLPPTGAAAGDLTGNYPNPSIAANAVGNTKLLSDAGSLLKVSGGVATSSGGSIGIGTTTPGAKLDVAGTAKMTGFQLGTAATAGQVLTTSASGVGTWQPLSLTSIAAGGDLTGTYPNPTIAANAVGNTKLLSDAASLNKVSAGGMTALPNGNIGVGTAAPAAKLDVNGIAKMTGFQLGASASAGQVLTADSTGTGTWQPLPPLGLAELSLDLQAQLLPVTSTNYSAPSVIGSAVTGTNPYAVAVSGGYAYVANYGSNTLQIFNVSNPAAPTLAGSVGTGTNPYSVAVSGNYAYVVNYGSNSLQIFDVSNPAIPTVAGSVTTGTNPESVAVSGNSAYVANFNSNTVQIFNVSNPASPALAGTIPGVGGPRSIAVSGSYLYVVSTFGNYLFVFNVSNPASITQVGYASTASYPFSVALSGDYAYVASSPGNALQVYNVSNPASPTLTGSASTGTAPSSVAVSGGYAFVTNSGSNSLQIFNVSDPANPTLDGSISTGTQPRCVAVSNSNAYVVNGGSNSLQIFGRSVQFPAGATFVGNVGIGTTTPTQKLQVIGNICATGSIGACSDARFKEHIEPMAGALEKVEQLRGVTFNWKRDEFRDHQFAEGLQVGFIAQEVEKVVPQVVSTGTDGYKAVDYSRLTPLLVEAIKQVRGEKDKQIASLKSENAELKSRLDLLEAAVHGASK